MDLAASLAANAVDAQVIPGTLTLIFFSAAEEIETIKTIIIKTIGMVNEYFPAVSI